METKETIEASKKMHMILVEDDVFRQLKDLKKNQVIGQKQHSNIIKKSLKLSGMWKEVMPESATP